MSTPSSDPDVPDSDSIPDALLGSTAPAPSFRQPLASTAKHRDGPPAPLAPGAEIEDFRIERLLGSGSFARVYLALEVSLGRHVALKVSENRGSEARTLAQLEHTHIVQIFREAVMPSRNLRLLCMQFVPGLTLDRIIAELKERKQDNWNGAAILEILDSRCCEVIALDLGGLAYRSRLESCDDAEAACLLGASLAEALAHAHAQGVIHRDIKPANILINRYGRPFLADFNIASSKLEQHEEAFGGTLSFMAPEHLDAFNPLTPTPPEAVDARSDVYSLGLVLFVFLTGRSPFNDRYDACDAGQSLLGLAAERRAGAPSVRRLQADIPELMDRLLRRCLAPDPERRFASARELMQALEGGRELQQVEKMPMSPIVRRFWRPAHPFAMILVLALIPHLLGSVVNIAYNQLRIVSEFTAEQTASFFFLVMLYNAVVYPAVVFAGVLVVRRALLGRRLLLETPDLPVEQAAVIRRQTLALPDWSVALAALGWFPGAVVFPLGLDLLSEPISLAGSWHFFVSFVLSGLIALTYAYFGVLVVVLRVLYPQLWSNPAGSKVQAQKELAPLGRRMRFFQALAVLIPLTGAVLLIGVGPEQLSVSFRVLVVGLIVLGAAGLVLTTMVCHRLDLLLARLTTSTR